MFVHVGSRSRSRFHQQLLVKALQFKCTKSSCLLLLHHARRKPAARACQQLQPPNSPATWLPSVAATASSSCTRSAHRGRIGMFEVMLFEVPCIQQTQCAVSDN
jgi:hypothetical protein